MKVVIGTKSYNVTPEAESLICNWVDMASKKYPLVYLHEHEIAAALITAGIKNAGGTTITAPDIYTGWARDVSEKMIPSIGLCPPHECVFRSIVENKKLIKDILYVGAVEEAVKAHWRQSPADEHDEF